MFTVFLKFCWIFIATPNTNPHSLVHILFKKRPTKTPLGVVICLHQPGGSVTKIFPQPQNEISINFRILLYLN